MHLRIPEVRDDSLTKCDSLASTVPAESCTRSRKEEISGSRKVKEAAAATSLLAGR